MDYTTKSQILALLHKAGDVADTQNNGLLDRDELASVIRELVAETQQILLDSERPALWPQHIQGPRHRDLI